MNIEAIIQPHIVKAIFETYEKKLEYVHRPHLGGSQIGKPCERALWYQFRWAGTRAIEGRILRLFETGHREEARVVENLRAAGLEVWDIDPDTGKQISRSAFGGHFAVNLDGVVKGLKESSKPHVLEVKTMNDRNFKTLSSKGCEVAQPGYWSQMQIGMHMTDLDRALFVVVNKNTDEIYAERVRIDTAAALQLLAKAERIILTDKAPQKIGKDESFWGCKFCDYLEVCHRGKLPEVNCRTCAHVTAKPDGTWSCVPHATCADGMAGCDDHIWNPSMMPASWTVSDAGDDWIEYKTDDGEIIRNHPGTSQKLRASHV